MPKIAYKTMSFVVLRILLFCASGALQLLCVYLIYRTGLELTAFHPLLNTLIRPALIFIGLGIGTLGHHVFMRPIIHIASLGHVVAATAVVLELPIKGSLFKFASEQIMKTFLQLTFSSLVSIKAMKKLGALKEAILQNDIMGKFQIPSNWFLKKIIDICLFDLRGLLSMIDEILVSFTWFATYMFLKYDTGGKKGVRIIASNQAKFMLEGLVYILRVFPHLLIANVGYGAMFMVINFTILVAVFATIWVLFGLTWWLIPLVFLTHRTLKDIIYTTLIYNFRLCFVISVYYKQINKIESVSQEDIISLVSKIPCLKFLAKKTKLDEFKDLEESPEDILQSSMSGLVEMSAIDESLKKTVNSIAKCFMVNEKDILKITPSEESMEASEETTKAEEPEPEPVSEEAAASSPDVVSKIKPISELDLAPEEIEEEVKYGDLFGRT